MIPVIMAGGHVTIDDILACQRCGGEGSPGNTEWAGTRIKRPYQTEGIKNIMPRIHWGING